jgi:hypothetical protein
MLLNFCFYSRNNTGPKTDTIKNNTCNTRVFASLTAE